MTGYVTLVIGFQWAHTALLEGFGASAGKRLCGLLVVAGHDGGPVGIARAVLRRAVLDACIGGSACLAFVLTGVRQFADPWPAGRFDDLADYSVLFMFWTEPASAGSSHRPRRSPTPEPPPGNPNTSTPYSETETHVRPGRPRHPHLNPVLRN